MMRKLEMLRRSCSDERAMGPVGQLAVLKAGEAVMDTACKALLESYEWQSLAGQGAAPHLREAPLSDQLPRVASVRVDVCVRLCEVAGNHLSPEYVLRHKKGLI